MADEAKGARTRVMPAEWAPHARTWMAWPARGEEVWGPNLAAARDAYAELAKTIAAFEQVTMIARPDLVADASLAAGGGVSVLSMPHDDSWTRDTGPSFVQDRTAPGGLAAVDWRFNAWGRLYGGFEESQAMAKRIAEHAGVPVVESPLVMEGGGVHVDGAGTALVCEGSLLDPARNPDWDKPAIEAELARTLGTTKVIWLPRWLADDETRGHVDNLACFTAPGKVLTLDPATARGEDREGLEANLDALQAATDAGGYRLEVELLPLPKPKERWDGRALTRTYVNFYLVNGGVIVPSFEDSADDKALKTIQRAFPDRQAVQIEADAILQGGGGVHCVTQQQPLPEGEGESA